MKKIQAGVLYALASSLIFSIMNILVKATSSTLPSIEIVFFRSVIGLVILFFIMKQRKISFSKRNRKILVLRGVLGGAYMIAYFMALSKLPLLDTMVLVNLSPIFVFIFSMVFLKESLPKGLLPVVCNCHDRRITDSFHLGLFESFGWTALLGIGAAFFSGGAATSIRYLGKAGHHPLEIIFYFMMMSTAISVVIMWNQFVMPSPIQWVALILIGVVSLLAQVYLTRAFTCENAIVVEMVRYSGIAINALWGFIIWNEIPSISTLLGGSLIILGCIVLNRIKKCSNGKSK